MKKTGSILLPAAFTARMEKLLGKEYPDFLNGYSQPSVTGLRVNTLKIDANDFEKISPTRLEPIPWCPSGYSLINPATDLTRPGKHPFHAAGLYYLQDPSAMAVAEILNPQPGERVLDLAAAPGGKTTHLAALMGEKGLLVANEIHHQRVWALTENLERWGVKNAIVTNESPQRLEAHFGDFFDRVLLDAPCSGEGMFRKSEEALQAWSQELVQSCAIRQLTLLEIASRMVRPGGYLVYSTCTFAPEENEQVVAQFIARNDEQFSLKHIPDQPGFTRAVPLWGGKEAVETAHINHAVRLWPHHGAAEGHFIALFQRKDEDSRQRKKSYVPKRPERNKLAFNAFAQKSLSTEFRPERMVLQGSYLYQTPDECPNLSGLRVIHPGWWVGVMKKNRVEPTHALALGLYPTDALQRLDFFSGEPRLLAYLRGESLPSPGPDGWVLVTIKTEIGNHLFPIGWGKRSQGILKNFYPRGLRQY
jgi:NOL1/NOP2/sun family putative RNA methylase